MVFAAHKENHRFAVPACAARLGAARDGFVHEEFGFRAAAHRHHGGMRDGAYRGEIGGGLVAGAVGRILETDVAEDGNHRRLT